MMARLIWTEPALKESGTTVSGKDFQGKGRG